MNLSAKTEYACIAVLELALHYESDQPVQVRKIARSHGIPSRFLVQILLQLKGAGLVSSTRGVAGGYRLSRAPGQITLWEVMRAIDGAWREPAREASEESAVCRSLSVAWRAAGEAFQRSLDAITFTDLAEQVRAPAENMYYI